MPDQLHKTKGIVLKTVKYGETSLIVTMFTELFGLQSYMVNGVRTATKKAGAKSVIFQPAAILDMVVYHSELKKINRIKEYKWAHIYQHILSDVPKNAVSLFMIELITKCLKQPETNPELFEFIEDALLHLDRCSNAVMGNFPLFFALHLPVFFGFRISPNPPSAEAEETAEHFYLDLAEGEFTMIKPLHNQFLEGKYAALTSQLLKVQHPSELEDIRLNQAFRRNLLFAYEQYFALHVQDFGTLRTLPVLREILG